MDWILPIIVLVTAYALVAFYIYKNKLWPEYITFYGPFMAIKTEKVGFFDRSIQFSTFLRVYGTLGVAMVVIVSALMTIMLFFSIQHIVVQRPPLTAANDLKNVLAIPGVNDFIPFTFAVWLGLLATMVVHEFGHAVGLKKDADVRGGHHQQHHARSHLFCAGCLPAWVCRASLDTPDSWRLCRFPCAYSRHHPQLDH
jgi:hypothetical protein